MALKTGGFFENICRVSLSTRRGVHTQPDERNDQSLYFINFII